MNHVVLFLGLIFFGVVSLAQNSTEVPIRKIPMTLKWNPIDGAINYSVMISRTAHFYKARAFKIKTTRFPVEVEPQGTYYWTVTALNENDEEISDKPVITFEPKAKEISVTQLTAKGETMEKTRVSLYSPLEETRPSYNNIDASSLAVTPVTVLGLSLYFELEGGLLSFEQKHAAIADVNTDGLLFPSLSLGIVSPEYWDLVSFEFNLQQNISDFKSNTSGVTLQNNSFRWLGYGIQSIFKYKSGSWAWYPYLNIQKMSTPFFTVSGSSLDIQEINYLNGGLGLRLHYLRDPSLLQYAVDLSYLSELSADSSDFSSMNIQKGEFLNLEISASKRLTSIISASLFARGQWINLEETVTSEGTTSVGTREASYWGLGARLAIDF
jgi:hypothetical protein